MIQRLLPLLLLFLLSFSNTQAENIKTKRIVSVDSSSTEILINMGLADQIVATDMTSLPLLKNKKLPNLGYHRMLSAEGILATKPDLVIGSDVMGPPNVVATLKQSPVRLIQLPLPTTVAQLTDKIQQLGKLLNEQDKVGALVEKVKAEHSEITSLTGDKKLNMVFLLNLNQRGLSQAGKGTTGDALITLLGGNNIAQYSGYKSVSMEGLIATNPDVILIGQESTLSPDELIKQYPLISQTNAEKNNRVLPVNAAELIAGISLGAVKMSVKLAQDIYKK